MTSQEFLVQPFRPSQIDTPVAFVPAHLNFADLHFLFLAIGQEIVFDFFAPCTSSGNSFIQRIKLSANTASRVNTQVSGNRLTERKDSHLTSSIGLHHQCVFIVRWTGSLVDSAHGVVVAEAEFAQVGHNIDQSLRHKDHLFVNLDWESGLPAVDLVDKVRKRDSG